MKNSSPLLRAVAGLPVESFRPHFDEKGHYESTFDPDFPFAIRLFSFKAGEFTEGLNWHEFHELYSPLDGPARFQMGNQVVRLEAGDLLMVDHLKLHTTLGFPRLNTRVLSIEFLPEFVYGPGSPFCDYSLLFPFYCPSETHPHVLRAGERQAQSVHAALADLIACYASGAKDPIDRAGCRVFFLTALYRLASRFQVSETRYARFVRQQELASRFNALFDFVKQHYPERISVDAAASLVHMSRMQFMRQFKAVTGMSFVAYLNHVRLSRAYQLVVGSAYSIGEIAAQTGFADQSHLDRQFKKAFGHCPNRLRYSSPGRPTRSGR